MREAPEVLEVSGAGGVAAVVRVDREAGRELDRETGRKTANRKARPGTICPAFSCFRKRHWISAGSCVFPFNTNVINRLERDEGHQQS